MELKHLVKECKNNSVTAQKCLYELFAHRLFTVCRRYMKTDQDAEEMTLNTFLKLFDNLNRFNYSNDAAWWMWIKKIAINECLMQLRKKENFLLAINETALDISTPATVLDNLSAAEIYGLITTLPIGYRTVFNLYAVEGYSHKEIGALLGITESTSKSQLCRAKHLLQQTLILNETHHARKSK